jgi:hypothetical protein
MAGRKRLRQMIRPHLPLMWCSRFKRARPFSEITGLYHIAYHIDSDRFIADQHSAVT